MKYLVCKKFGSIEKGTVIETMVGMRTLTDGTRIIAHANIRKDKDFQPYFGPTKTGQTVSISTK